MAFILIIKSLTAFALFYAANASSDIVGGNQAQPSQFPFIVSLQKGCERGNCTHICGGTLIDRLTVLTAAHCFDRVNDPQRQVTILSGTTDLRQNGTKTPIAMVRLHEGYIGSPALIHDIAIARLANPVEVEKIPSINIRVVGEENVTVAGWGFTSDGGPLSDNLKYLDTATITNAECRKRYFSLIDVRPTELCINNTRDQTACSGDSGGPLLDEDGSLVGIVSFGGTPCTRGLPVVFSRISAYVDWIENSHL